jgi:hypothetical protein
MLAYGDIKKIYSLRRVGYTLREIGVEIGVTSERVRQVLVQYYDGSIPVHKPKPKHVVVKVYHAPTKLEEQRGSLDYIDRKLVRHLQGRDRNRELVRIRDGHACQACGKKWEVSKRRFDVHHLEGMCGKKSLGYDRLEDVGILITLCHECHFNHHQFSQNLSTALSP